MLALELEKKNHNDYFETYETLRMNFSSIRYRNIFD